MRSPAVASPRRPEWRGRGRGAGGRASGLLIWLGLLASPTWLATPARAAPAPAPGPAVRPPVILEQRPAIYPREHVALGLEPEVVLFVTVLASGAVDEVTVQRSGGAGFDEAAIASVRAWRFAPARRGDAAIDSRIRVSVRFTKPAPEPEPEPPEPEPEPEPEADAPPIEEAAADDEPIDITVRGERELRAEDRGASSFALDRELLEAAPRQEAAEVLRSAPGVYIGRGEGLAVAHHYMLRGFDAEHGQDIEMRVGGLPINMPSHVHGQGYADLGFLVAETIDALRVTEGVYDPRQGDFAVAGTFDIRLGVRERGWRLSSGYGRFNTFRQLALWAPRDQPRETFAAAQYTRSDGFGQQRAGQAASGVVQARLGDPARAWSYRLIAFLHGARAELAGVVRADDVASGSIGLYDAYPYPTARAQSAFAGRVMAGFFPEYRGHAGDNADLGLWFGFDDFRLQENFTGFTQKSQTLADVAGRGDLFELQNRTFSAGLRGRYRTRPYQPAWWLSGTVELGIEGRLDHVGQAQNLIDAAVRNQTWDRRVDATVIGADLGMFGDLDWRFTQYLRLRLGVRADVLSYDIDDRLGNFAPSTRPEDAFLPGFRRSALGVAAGPRTSVEVTPRDWLAILAAYGEGYRSPQARTLEDGERAPFTKVRSGDLGLRFGRDERVMVTTAGYFTRLSDDVAFEAREGRLERIGASQRLGAVLAVQSQPLTWLIGQISVTYVHATLLEPPPATAADPQPPYVEGQRLPYVPPVVARADLGVRGPLARQGTSWPLSGRLGAGFSYLSPRPLPYGADADHVPLLDLSGGLRFGPLELGAAFFNVLNRRYAAIEYNFASHWDPSSPRPRTPARHLAAGAPFSFMITLGVQL